MTNKEKDLFEAMRSNITAKEAIWGSLIRDNMELETKNKTLEAALEKALKLVKGGK